MSKNIIYVVFSAIILLAGCTPTSKYQIKAHSSSLTFESNNPELFSMHKAEVLTPSSAMKTGMAFGIVGVLVADAVTKNTMETFGVELQKNIVQSLYVTLNNAGIGYQEVDILEAVTDEEISVKIKSNRMWGFKSSKPKELEQFFSENPEISYTLSVQPFLFESRKANSLTTLWTVYNKEYEKVLKIKTTTVGDFTSKLLDAESYMNNLLGLQSKNTDEFIKLYRTI